MTQVPRYHLHPETGEPARCRATVSCPFGSLETEHYDSPGEARRGFEQRMRERVLEARHRKPRSTKQELVEALLEERVGALSEEDGRRTVLASVLARHSEADSRVKTAQLQWALQRAAEEFHDLRRHDLQEAVEWASDVLHAASNTDWWQEEQKLQEVKIAAAERALALLKAKDDSSYPHRGEDIRYYSTVLRESREELEALKVGEGEALEADRAHARALGRKPFRQAAQPLQEGDKVYDGVNEFRFHTSEGGEHTLRELLSSSYAYSGKFTVAQGEALAAAQEHAQALVKLLEVEGRFEFPQRGDYSEDDEWGDDYTQGERDQLFPPREGFRLIGAGGEVNVYLHEATQLVFKVPHSHSHLFLDFQESSRQRLLVKRAVELVEERYAGVEGSLERLSERGVDNFEYLKTYFVNTTASDGLEVPVVVQPKLDMEVYRPAEVDTMSYTSEEGRGESVSGELKREGFTDLHRGNVFYNLRTEKFVLLDCLFVTELERQGDYRARGLLPEDAF